MNGSHDHKLGTWLELLNTLDDILRRVLFHFLSADGRIGVTDAGKEQSQVLIDFGRRTDCTSWVTRDDFLFNSDSRRNAANVVAFRLVHTSQELTGIRRETLDITTLPLGIQRVESQRRFATARNSGNNN